MKFPQLYSQSQLRSWESRKRTRRLSLLDEAIGNLAEEDCPLKTRFWLRVKKGKKCWEWQGGISPSGYGRMHCLNLEVPSHRLAYLLSVGDIPPSLLVLHHCDNKRCVRPRHLFVGTVKDNSLDALKKGRLNLSGLKLGPKTPKKYYRGKLLRQAA